MKKSFYWRVAQFFEIRWWTKYLANKDVDTYLKWKRGYWDGIIAKIHPYVVLKPDQYILDAGCGPAGIFIDLPDYKVTAFDPLLDTYEEKLAHFKRAMYPNVEFHHTSLESFVADKEFDVVFCMNCINHVSQIDEAFLVLYNSAKKGGKIVLTIDAHNHRLYKFIAKLQHSDILHPHQYDLDEYKAMLTSLGCTVTHTELEKKEFLFNHYILVAEKN